MQDPPHCGQHTDTHTVQGFTPEEEHGLKVFNLSNIKLIFLPPIVTAKSPSCDQGIIASYKVHFRGLLVWRMLEQANKPGNENKQLKDLAPTFFFIKKSSGLCWLGRKRSLQIPSRTAGASLACCPIQCWT
jgi:hypothetical protein